jgi:hypothetical protein
MILFQAPAAHATSPRADLITQPKVCHTWHEAAEPRLTVRPPIAQEVINRVKTLLLAPQFFLFVEYDLLVNPEFHQVSEQPSVLPFDFIEFSFQLFYFLHDRHIPYSKK